MKTAWSMAALITGVIAVACEVAPPTSPTREAPVMTQAEAPEASGVVTSQGMTKEPINGLIHLLNNGPPGGILMTPGGQCHFTDVPGYTRYEGDVVGSVTFRRRVVNQPCDGGHLTGSGPVDGDVTWNGRAGAFSGQWTTNCKADSSQPTGISCDGTMNVRGSGGLAGVQFHFKWGPGWFPFPYTGTAFSQ
jgi:hypothetical protein